jgi:hypothetical protein
MMTRPLSQILCRSLTANLVSPTANLAIPSANLAFPFANLAFLFSILVFQHFFAFANDSRRHRFFAFAASNQRR